jgi:hypothetical protein
MSLLLIALTIILASFIQSSECLHSLDRVSIMRLLTQFDNYAERIREYIADESSHKQSCHEKQSTFTSTKFD